MTKQAQPQKQATWKTLLIIGIVSAVVWIFTTFSGSPENSIDAAVRMLSGVTALIGLLGGLILLISSRKD